MNIKKLTEDKNTKMVEMQNLLNKVKNEERAFTEEEQKLFEQLKNEVEAINNTIKAFDDARQLETEEQKEEQKSEENKKDEEQRALEIEERDIKDFANYIRSILSQRAETATNFSIG